jgi:hypothetical protein
MRIASRRLIVLVSDIENFPLNMSLKTLARAHPYVNADTRLVANMFLPTYI